MNYTRTSSLNTVQRVCCDARNDYNVIWERKYRGPCVYVANHALWCLDDIVALGAVSRRGLSVVINTGPSGLSGIPEDCKEYMCVIQRKTNRKGEGYRAMNDIFKKEIIKRGKSLIVFIEDMNTKSAPDTPAPVRSGTLKLARELSIPVVPIWINWPCQFPTIINPCSKVLTITEGTVILTNNIGNTETIKKVVMDCWEILSKK